MNDFFVDREDLRKDILDILNDVQFNNIVYILSAKSGYGKSAFGQHIINQVKGEYLCFKISIPVGSNISLDEGFYFRNITTAVNKKSELYSYQSLREFLKNTDNPVIKRMFHTSISESLVGELPFAKAFSTLWNHNDILDVIPEYEHLFPDDSRYIYMVLTEYIFECFRYQKKVLLNIENIQTIDKLSLMKLQELLSKTNNIFLLLEYTSENDSLEGAKKFESNFYAEEVEVFTRRLKKLDFDNTCRILDNLYPNNSKFKNENSLKKIYFTIDGNIRQLSDIEEVYELSNDRLLSIAGVNLNYTYERLNNIKDKHQIMLLCIIVAHMGNVNIATLKHLLIINDYVSYMNLSELLSILCGENGLLKAENYNVSIAHDSILDNMKNIIRYEIKLTLAYTWWIAFYEGQLKKNSNFTERNIVIKNLCYFYSVYPPAAIGILTLLPDVRKIALNSFNPDEAVSFLLEFYDYIDYFKDTELINKINEFLLELYYELGIYNKAYTIFKNMSFQYPKEQVLYDAILQNRLQNCEKAIILAKEGIKEYKSDKRFELCANLIILISAASKNDYKLCESVFETCIKEKSFEKYYEFGFLLRNAEIICTLKDSIDYLERSIEHFKKLKQPIMEAHSRISLLMNCSRIGDFEKAYTNLEVAKNILKGQSLERHILLNDEVAIQMCMGNFCLALQDSLKLAMCTAQDVFDKIIINKNLLIIYAKNEQWEYGQEIVDYLLNILERETNKLNICFTYWNISYFYKHFDKIQYDLYYNKYKNSYNELAKSSLRKNVADRNVYHKPNMEFVIEFISYWHFPIPKNW